MFNEETIAISNNNYHKKECPCCGKIKILPDGKWCNNCLDEIDNVRFDDCLTSDEILFGETFNVEIDPIYARVLEQDSTTYYDGTPKSWTASW